MNASVMSVGIVCLMTASAHAQVTQQWVARYNGPGNGRDSASAIALDGTGHVYVTGYSEGGRSGLDYATVAYDAATGTQLWVARYDGPGTDTDVANAIAVDGAGHVYVTGKSRSVAGDFDYATVAYDAATGTQLWVARYNGAGNDADIANAIAVDAAGHVYVTGQSWGGASDFDYATVAYDAATGTQLWVAVYNGPGNLDDVANAVTVASAGTVYVTGASRGDGGYLDYATVAYDAATGAQLWLARYDGPASRDDSATALAADGAGNIYVTGYSIDEATGFDYATVAYDGATGSQLWVARYDGPGNAADIAYAVAVDNAGQVYVTGQSWGGASNFDYATVAYDAMAGTQLWVARYDGPGSHSDFAYALVVDGAGNVYVTGQSNDASGSDFDYATVAYAAASGTQLWVARYHGPASGANAAQSLAVDGTGNVYVTGYSPGVGSGPDYATIKYSQP